MPIYRKKTYLQISRASPGGFDLPSGDIVIIDMIDRHAGRQTISVDDVMLLARRNEGLETVLEVFMEKQKASKLKRKTR